MKDNECDPIAQAQGNFMTKKEYFDILFSSCHEPGISITDIRDIKEMERRKKLKLFAPRREELYSMNPNFDGKYED